MATELQPRPHGWSCYQDLALDAREGQGCWEQSGMKRTKGSRCWLYLLGAVGTCVVCFIGKGLEQWRAAWGRPDVTFVPTPGLFQTSIMIRVKTQGMMSPWSDRNRLYLDFLLTPCRLAGPNADLWLPGPAQALTTRSILAFSSHFLFPCGAPAQLGGEEAEVFPARASPHTPGVADRLAAEKRSRLENFDFLLCKQGVACLPTSASQHGH